MNIFELIDRYWPLFVFIWFVYSNLRRAKKSHSKSSTPRQAPTEIQKKTEPTLIEVLREALREASREFEPPEIDEEDWQRTRPTARIQQADEPQSDNVEETSTLEAPFSDETSRVSPPITYAPPRMPAKRVTTSTKTFEFTISPQLLRDAVMVESLLNRRTVR